MQLALCASFVLCLTASAASLVQGDFDNDGNGDIGFVREGNYFVRPNASAADAAVHELTFAKPPRFITPDSMKAVDVDQDGFDDLLLASRTDNRLLLIYGQASLNAPFRSDEFALPGGPVAATADQFVAGGRLELLALLNEQSKQPSSANLAMLDASGSFIARYSLFPGSERLNSVGAATAALVRASPLPQFAWLSRGADQIERLSWSEFKAASPRSAPVAATEFIRTLTGLSSGGKLVDSSAQRLASGFLLGSGHDGHWVVFPSHTKLLAVVPAGVRPSSQPEAHIESLEFVAAGGALVTDPAGDLILATATDGKFARLFRWLGPGKLETVETIDAPPGYELANLLPLSGGNLFATLRLSGAGTEDWTHLASYDRQSGSKGWSSVKAWASSAYQRPVARVVVYDRDPFIFGGAIELETFTIGDWAHDAGIENGEIVVQLQDDAGAPGGLGTPTAKRLKPRAVLPGRAVALANQWEADSSLFFASSAVESSGAAISVQPVPGSYKDPVNVTFLAADDVKVRYRLDASEWQSGRGPILITKTTTLEYHGVAPSGGAGAIQTAHYAIGQARASLANAHGPSADTTDLDHSQKHRSDSDSSSKLQEANAGAEPRDSRATPTGAPTTERRITAQVSSSGAILLRLEGGQGAAVVVEYSNDLVHWLPSTNPPRPNADGSLSWQEAQSPADWRFFRVRYAN